MRIATRYLGLLLAASIACPSLRSAGGDQPLRRSPWAFAICDARVGNKEVRGCLDTGASYTLIDTKILQGIGAKPRLNRLATSHYRDFQVTIYSELEVSAGGAVPSLVSPGGFDTQSLFQEDSSPFQMIVGLDYLRKNTVIISSTGVALAPSLPNDFDLVSSTPFKLLPNKPIAIEVMIGEFGSEQFLIDTGCNGEMTVTPRLLRALKNENLCAEGLRSENRTLAGTETEQDYVLREVLVAGVQLRNVGVNEGKFNVVGFGVLRHLQLALDFPNQRLCVGRPPHTRIDRFPMNASGMGTSFNQNEQLMVRALRTDSPAAKAGIEVGDEILVIEGKDVEKLSFDDVTELFAQDGKTIQIQLRRGMDVRTVELALKLPFEYPPNWEAMDAKVEGFEKFLEEDSRNRKTDSK